MLLALEIVTVFFASIAMSMALAHALEYPGKLRLDERTYLAVQTIYYPGFTIGGIGEPLALIAILIFVLAIRNDRVAFGWALSALIAIAVMHGIFWIVTQPTNRYWLRHQQLGATGTQFFGMERAPAQGDPKVESPNWIRLRDRWEYSHIARAVLSAYAMIALVVAIAR